jgi:hypothetical protein
VGSSEQSARAAVGARYRPFAGNQHRILDNNELSTKFTKGHEEEIILQIVIQVGDELSVSSCPSWTLQRVTYVRDVIIDDEYHKNSSSVRIHS